MNAKESFMLAKWPPITSLISAFILLTLGSSTTYFFVDIIQNSSKWSNSFGAMAVLFITGILAFYWLILGLRIICRWLLVVKSTCICIKNEQIYFLLPKPHAWWSPLLKIQAAKISFNEIQKTYFSRGKKANFIIETERGVVIIPSGMFSLGGYNIDKQIREHICSNDIKPLEPEMYYNIQEKYRFIIPAIVFALVCIVLVILEWFFPKTVNTNIEIIVLLLFPFVVSSLGLLFLGKGGSFITDIRGFFLERNGHVSFLAWDDLREFDFSAFQFLKWKYWQRLIIDSSEGKIVLDRILWVGFPAGNIYKALLDKSETQAEE